MMGNRKQPFGYKMSLGEIVIQESEAKLEYLKQFQRESGYNDVFIPAMQRLSPAYREYHKSLQAANEVFLRHFQQE